MAQLNDDTGIDSARCHSDGFIIITDERKKFISGILEFCEELQKRLVVLTGSEHTDRNVMSEVINAVDERDFFVIAFHRHKLSIHHKKATETLGIAVGESDLIVVWESIQFFNQTSVGCICSFTDACSHRTDTCTLEM